MSDDVKALIAEARRWSVPEMRGHVSNGLLELVGNLADALEASERALAFERLRRVDEALEASVQAPAAVDRQALIRAIRFPTKWRSEGEPGRWEPEEWVLDLEDAGEVADHIFQAGILQDAAEVEARGLEKAAEALLSGNPVMGMQWYAEWMRARTRQVREGESE